MGIYVLKCFMKVENLRTEFPLITVTCPSLDNKPPTELTGHSPLLSSSGSRRHD